MSDRIKLYDAPDVPQPVSKLLTTELLVEILQKLPKGTRVCIYQDYEGDGGEFYVRDIIYYPLKNRVVINSDGDPNSHDADEMDKGAPWFTPDSDDE